MKLEVIPANQLTTKECNSLRSLTLRAEGRMMEALSDWRYDKEAKVVRLSDDDGRVISWALVHPYDARNNKDFQIYTRASQRRKGYGKMVYSKAVQVAGGRQSMIVHPHSSASTRFFNKVHNGPAGIPAFIWNEEMKSSG